MNVKLFLILAVASSLVIPNAIAQSDLVVGINSNKVSHSKFERQL